MKKYVVIDIDGTVADASHRIHLITGDAKKNWKEFFKQAEFDAPHVDMIDIIENLLQGDPSLDVVFCTGRSDEIRDITISWLNDKFWSLDFDEDDDEDILLLMRKEGDYRPDTEVKVELLSEAGITPANTLCIFEDRDGVVQVLRTNGFRVLQVANGNF
jgi:FMN phosphatase YigB (HAD superfamily)